MSENTKNRIFLGIDTSCYTSSAACVCIDGILFDERKLLSVKLGERGLRQSDGVFQHTRNMTEILPQLLRSIVTENVCGVGVSVQPSARENSYMPVFLVGKLLAETLGASLRVPVYGFTHQQGHIRAALMGNEELIGKSFYAFHLSGGTSDLLFVDENMNIERIGGSSDINAGQLVDRIGVKLGLEFPSGKHLERIAVTAGERGVLLPSSVRWLEFSFSGAETKASQAIESDSDPAKTAYSVFDLISRTLAKTIENVIAMNDEDECCFLFAGGVASSALLRSMIVDRLRGTKAKLFFSNPKLSSDNAVGTALLCLDRINAE